MTDYYETPDRTIGGDTLDTLSRTAKDNSVPLLLAGLGLAGYLLARSVGPQTRDQYWNDAKDAADWAGARVRSWTDQASETAEDAGGSVSNAGENIRETARSYADAAYRNTVAGYKVSRNHAAHYARQAPERGARIAGDAGSWARDNPIPLGLAALAFGAAAATFVTYRRDDDFFEHDEDFSPSPDPSVTRREPPVVQKRPRKRAAVKPAVVESASQKKAAKAPKPKSGKTSTKPRSPDLAAAIPAGKSKLGKNVVASTSVLGVAENEKKAE